MANFAPGHRIDISFDPKTAGSGSGGGVYPDGAPVTLLAEAKPGYLFTNWTESGMDSTRPVTITGSNKQVTVPLLDRRNFFRLTLPDILSAPSAGFLMTISTH